MAEVMLDRVSHRYGRGAMALRGLSLHVRDGELLAVVGPSGSGKSTALRVIAGLESPAEGEVRIGGARANDVPPHQRGVAMVPQNHALYPHMTIERNLRFSLEGGRAEARARARDAAAALGIGHLLGRYPGELSGGERQRAALAKAMARRPRVFLFDEPLSSLDVQLRGVARREIKSLHQQLGATMIHITHDQEEAMTLGGRIAVLHEGVLQQVGGPLEVYQKPANAFVAGFIGTPAMNFLAGRLVAEGGRMAFLESGERGVRLPIADVGADVLGRLPDGEVIAGFRPQALRTRGGAGEGARGGQGVLDVAVVLVEPLGEWTDITGTLPSGKHVVARLPERGTLATGQKLELVVEAPDVALFLPGPLGRNLLIDSGTPTLPPTSAAAPAAPTASTHEKLPP
jgi:multiple sugar transport system ATP-binding protein